MKTFIFFSETGHYLVEVEAVSHRHAVSLAGRLVNDFTYYEAF